MLLSRPPCRAASPLPQLLLLQRSRRFAHAHQWHGMVLRIERKKGKRWNSAGAGGPLATAAAAAQSCAAHLRLAILLLLLLPCLFLCHLGWKRFAETRAEQVARGGRAAQGVCERLWTCECGSLRSRIE